MGANAAKAQVVSTAEEVTAAVRRELTSGFDPNSIKETLQSSLGNLQLPKLDTNEIRGQFEKILNSSDVQSLAGSDILKNVNRQSFVDLVSNSTDLSKQDINQVVDQLEGVWQQTLGQQGGNSQEQLLNLLKSATPEELKSDQLNAQLEQLIGGTDDKEKSSSGLRNRMLQYGIEALIGTVIGRADLSDLDVEKISGQLQKLTGKAKDQANQTAKPFSTIKADIENYLLFSAPWELNRETIKQQFRDVIYDPEASPGSVRNELEQLNREYFVELLGLRDDFTPEGVQEVANYLEDIRQDVFSSVQTSEAQEQSQDLRSRVENYLRSTGKGELNPEGIQQDFKTLLEDPEAGLEALRDRLSQFDRDTLVQLLKERQDISEEEANQIIGQLESTRDNVLTTAQDLQEQAKSQAEELRHKVEEYLRNTNKDELNPEGIKRDFKTLIDDPQAGLSALRSRLSQFDRDTLVQLLSQRQDLSEEQVNQVLDSIESTRDSILQAPQKLAGKAKEQYEQTTSAIAEYLRNTNLEELNPEGIKSDLAKLLDDPKAGALALRGRLSQVDRETLVQLLSQREDLSEEQVNRLIDEVQEAIRSFIKAPRRLATRAQKQVLNFEANLESYLRNTNKAELEPEGIKRDLQLLLNDPRAGVGNIGDRLSQFDRSTLVALLSQREDISEEEANRIADQIESVRNSFVEQLTKVQQGLQSAIDGIFGKIRNYLNSMERPELNYEGIQQDFSQLFDDPQAGFEALRDRLSHFDRDTLVAVISSRQDISEADANRIIDQIEATRDRVLHQAERIQSETQKRLSALKEQAKKQAVETRKAASDAAWWLFSTALTSLAASAVAGALAVAGIGLIG
jgi:nucleoid DNA-binding protein